MCKEKNKSIIGMPKSRAEVAKQEEEAALKLSRMSERKRAATWTFFFGTILLGADSGVPAFYNTPHAPHTLYGAQGLIGACTPM